MVSQDDPAYYTDSEQDATKQLMGQVVMEAKFTLSMGDNFHDDRVKLC